MADSKLAVSELEKSARVCPGCRAVTRYSRSADTGTAEDGGTTEGGRSGAVGCIFGMHVFHIVSSLRRFCFLYHHHSWSLVKLPPKYLSSPSPRHPPCLRVPVGPCDSPPAPRSPSLWSHLSSKPSSIQADLMGRSSHVTPCLGFFRAFSSLPGQGPGFLVPHTKLFTLIPCSFSDLPFHHFFTCGRSPSHVVLRVVPRHVMRYPASLLSCLPFSQPRTSFPTLPCFLVKSCSSFKSARLFLCL